MSRVKDHISKETLGQVSTDSFALNLANYRSLLLQWEREVDGSLPMGRRANLLVYEAAMLQEIIGAQIKEAGPKAKKLGVHPDELLRLKNLYVKVFHKLLLRVTRDADLYSPQFEASIKLAEGIPEDGRPEILNRLVSSIQAAREAQDKLLAQPESASKLLPTYFEAMASLEAVIKEGMTPVGGGASVLKASPPSVGDGVVVLSTIDDGLAYLEAINAGLTNKNFKFDGELASIHIVIEGERYNSSVPAELARGIWQFQEQIYSAVAFALHGSADIRKLTATEREDFELVFQVSDGCSDFLAPVTKFMEKLGEGFAKMDNTTKKSVIIAIAIIFAFGSVGAFGITTYADVQKEHVKAGQAVELEQQRTAQFQMLVNVIEGQAIASRFRDAFSDGNKAVIRSASDATAIEVGRWRLEKNEIQDLKRRESGAQKVSDVLDAEFHIFKVDVQLQGISKFMLAPSGAGEFVATINESKFSKTELAAVMAAARDHQPIRLEVLLLRVNGEIRSAEILQVRTSKG